MLPAARAKEPNESRRTVYEEENKSESHYCSLNFPIQCWEQHRVTVPLRKSRPSWTADESWCSKHWSWVWSLCLWDGCFCTQFTHAFLYCEIFSIWHLDLFSQSFVLFRLIVFQLHMPVTIPLYLWCVCFLVAWYLKMVLDDFGMLFLVNGLCP